MWFRQLIRMPPGYVPMEVFYARPKSEETSKTQNLHLIWSGNMLKSPRKLESIAREKDVWKPLLRALNLFLNQHKSS